jgi:hypothetical protein
MLPDRAPTDLMLSTKLWFVTHVAMAMTASPIMDASKTRHPSCSRMGIRILTIALHTRHRRVFFCYNGRPRAKRRGGQGQSARATRKLQLGSRSRSAEDDGVGGARRSCVHPMPRCRYRRKSGGRGRSS